MYTIKQAKASAISCVEESLKKECLFKKIDMPDEEEWNYSKGDPESLETISSLVMCDPIVGFENSSDDAESEVLKHLRITFPLFA
ncbi:MAG: hypothetical protein HRT95_05785 [Moritella sp.]|uniref:hypothetical protein n=1 Tax=Moritella sp. TaxID=78556 RepID=UPI001E06A777|nr:hypothetical protein [Moritella sp.]NQZ49702.1 hypothetical protein [Moritella sp.]